MWDLCRPGLEPVSPALAGGFLTTAPPGKPHTLAFSSKSLQEAQWKALLTLSSVLAEVVEPMTYVRACGNLMLVTLTSAIDLSCDLGPTH